MKKGILIFILAVSASVFGKENLNNVKIVTSSNVVTSNFSSTDSNFEKDRKDIIDLYEKFKNSTNISRNKVMNTETLNIMSNDINSYLMSSISFTISI